MNNTWSISMSSWLGGEGEGVEQDVVNVNGDDTSLPEKLFKFSSKPSSKLFSNSLADWLPERLRKQAGQIKTCCEK